MTGNELATDPLAPGPCHTAPPPTSDSEGSASHSPLLPRGAPTPAAGATPSSGHEDRRTEGGTLLRGLHGEVGQARGVGEELCERLVT